MNYSYIYSIIELYLKNENNDKKANLNISKVKEKISLKFNMVNESKDVSNFDIPTNEINNYISKIINIFKGNLLVIDEKLTYNSKKRLYNFQVKFSNGRILSFSDFSIIEINNIRNILFNIDTFKDEIRVQLDDDSLPKMNYKPRLQQTGFISFKSVAFITIFFAILLVISFLVFNLVIK